MDKFSNTEKTTPTKDTDKENEAIQENTRDKGLNETQSLNHQVVALETHLIALRSLGDKYEKNMQKLISFVGFSFLLLAIIAGFVSGYDINGRVAEIISYRIQELYPPEKIESLFKEGMKEKFICTTISLIEVDRKNAALVTEHIISIDNAVFPGTEKIFTTCDLKQIEGALKSIKEYLQQGPDIVTPPTFWLLTKINNAGGNQAEILHEVFSRKDRDGIFNSVYSNDKIQQSAGYIQAVKSFCNALKDEQDSTDYCLQYK